MQVLVVSWHHYPPGGIAVERKRAHCRTNERRACIACIVCIACVCVCACMPRLSSPSWARSTRVWPSSARAAARPSAHRSAKRQTLRPPPQSAAAAALRERALPKGAVLTRCNLLAEGHCDAAAAVKRAERVPVCAYVQPSRQAAMAPLRHRRIRSCKPSQAVAIDPFAVHCVRAGAPRLPGRNHRPAYRCRTRHVGTLAPVV